MKKFMDKDFLLSTETAKKLYVACENTPIFDWHCHLQPKEIYENKTPEDIAYLWLAGDHYKWRGMRSCGISEEYITGDKSPYEKFKAWASAMPNLIGNPLYHWTHLELQRYFDIYEPLSPATCDEIWEKANAKIKAGGFTPRELIEKSNVAFVCTTDDAADTLEYHKLLREDKSFKCKVLPAFRPDKALGIELPGYCEWVQALESVMGKRVESFTELKEAMLSPLPMFPITEQVRMSLTLSIKSVLRVRSLPHPRLINIKPSLCSSLQMNMHVSAGVWKSTSVQCVTTTV